MSDQPTNPRPHGRRVRGTVAFCQKDWFVTPRPFATCARELQAWVTEVLPEGQCVRFLEEAGTDHSTVRNNIVRKFWGDWVLQLDCDHTFPPDTLHRMLRVFDERKLDVLTGVYYARNEPHYPILYQWSEEREVFHHLATWPNDPFTMPGLGAGGGCMLIRRSVFDRLAAFAAQMPMARYASTWQNYAPFNRIPEIEMSEDLSFYYRCMLVGIKVWCHPGVQCGHLRMADVSGIDFARYSECMPKTPIQMVTN